MTRLWLALWLLLAAPSSAAPVQVTSGEHDGFTRLVLNYGRVVDWQMGRSDDGYELQLDGLNPSYDLRQAFDLIGKSRLAAIWVDPNTGALHVGLACACHAIPFEFRPGIVVIDLKDGPPPKGSAFELALDGSEARPLAAPPPARPKPRPMQGNYDWQRLAYENMQPTAQLPESHQPEILPPDPALNPLRESLLHQMAQGAAQGVVSMQKPGDRPPLPQSEFPLAQIRIGDQPGNVLRKDGSVKPDLTATGDACIPAESLNIAEWGDETRPLADQFAEAKAGLIGEFDRPEPEAVARNIRFQLYVGFGVEARQTLDAFADDASDGPTLRALSYLLDGGADPDHLFRGMTACEGPAALWAMLEYPAPTKGESVATGAVRLAFSALPLHLRRLIGPRLAERFLELGDGDSARAFQDAILRAPSDRGAEVALMEANLNLHQGNAAEAEAKLSPLLADPGPNTPEALIALTEARSAQNLPITPDVAESLQAILPDYRDTALAPKLNRALVLAHAASGDFETAFAGLAESPDTGPKIWELAVTLAPDDVFLTLAVLDDSTALPPLSDDLRQSIARRVLGLGLAHPALRWLDGLANPDPILKAQIALGRGDGRSALVALAGLEGEEAQALSLRALEIIGQEAPRAIALNKAEKPEDAALALARAGDWAGLADSTVESWQVMARQLAPSSTAGPPLAKGHDLLTAGETTRSAITALLASLPNANTP